TEMAAATLGVKLQLFEVGSPDDLEQAFEAATQEGAEAVVVLAGGVTFSHLALIANLAAARQLPTVTEHSAFARVGGLMAYGQDLPSQWRRAAYFVDRILKGAKPADLPVEQPMTFDFVVNMKTARELGITFPNEIMLQVTEVIQ